MTFVPMVDHAVAEGETRVIYDRYATRLGWVPNVVRALSGNPELHRLADNFRRSVSHGAATLDARREQMIATLVADHLRCHY